MSAPYAKGSATSRKAAEEIESDTNRLRRLVLGYLRECGVFGATDEEIGQALELSGNTVRPRRGELVKRGAVVASGLERDTMAGRKATVWRAVERTERAA